MFKYNRKTVFPHRYSKLFYDYWWTHTALWDSLLSRLRIEKDAMVLITGDTGCQPKGSKVLMSSGRWKNIENIKIRENLRILCDELFTRIKQKKQVHKGGYRFQLA